MSEMLIGVLRMPPELFWSDDEMTRLQHDNIRREAADEIERLQAECERLRKDKARLDWLADPENAIGNVELPVKAVLENAHCMRAAIDAAMKGGGE